MGTPLVDLLDDHVRVKLDRMASIATLSGDLTIPYSTVREVDVVAPEWPPFLPLWRVGVHVPGVVAKGRFRSSFREPTRFLWLDRKSQRVLRMRLDGHPQLSEVALDVPDAESLRDQIAKRLGRK